MSPDKANIDPVVLLVSDSNDADVASCIERLSNAGIRVDRATSVYAAAAELATRRGEIRHVLLDIRSLDDKEMAIHRMVKRSFPDTTLIVPLFSGADARAATYGPGIRPTSIDSAIADLIEIHGNAAESEQVEAIALPPVEDVAVVNDVESASAVETDEIEDASLPDEELAAHEASESEANDDVEQHYESVSTPAYEPAEEPAPSSELDADESLETSTNALIADTPTEDATQYIQPPSPTPDERADDETGIRSDEESSREAYQTVRERLAAQLRGNAQQRTPPRRRPPGTTDFSPTEEDTTANERPTSMLSPEEMDALMTNQEDDPTANTEGGGA